MIVKHSILCTLTAALLAASGCGIPPKARTSAATDASPLDNATSGRMHDICGSLLLFQNAYKRLPASLDELVSTTGLAESKTMDPATGKRFWYAQEGFARSPDHGVIVLLAEPASAGDVCYGIAMWGVLPSLNARVVPLEAGAWAKLTAGREATP